MSVVLSVYADQIEQDYRTLTTGVPGSVTHNYTDVTSEQYKTISFDYTYPLNEWYILYFRIPIPAWIETVTINKIRVVKLPLHKTGTQSHKQLSLLLRKRQFSQRSGSEINMKVLVTLPELRPCQELKPFFLT